MATTAPAHVNPLPELFSTAQLARECKVSINLVKDRLYTGEIRPDFRSGRTQLFDADRLPELRVALRPRY